MNDNYISMINCILGTVNDIRQKEVKDITDIKLIVNEKMSKFMINNSQYKFEAKNDEVDKTLYVIGTLAGMQVIVNKSLMNDNYYVSIEYETSMGDTVKVNTHIENVLKDEA